MKYDQFLALPVELKLQIIRKCYPIPYVRLRQSCRFLDEFCERNRRRLGIYCYRKDPHLQLTNSIWYSGFRRSIDQDPSINSERQRKVDEINYHLIVNYGKKGNDSNFIVPMTRENLPRIRGSLSGFAFTRVIVEFRGYPPTDDIIKKRDEALAHFLNFAVEFRVKKLSFSELTLAQLKLLTNTWQADCIDLYTTHTDLREFLQLDSVKKVPSVSYVSLYTDYRFDEKRIWEASRGKEYLCIHEWMLLPSTAWTALKCIYEDWTKVADVPEMLALEFTAVDYYHLDLKEEAAPHLPKRAVYFGSYSREYIFKYDIWLIETKNKNHWRILTVKRGSMQYEGFVVQTARSKEQLAMLFIEYARDYRRESFPIDYSTFYDLLTKADTIEDVKAEVSNLFHFVDLCSDEEE